MGVNYKLHSGGIRVALHFHIGNLFLPPNKQNENVSSVYSSAAWRPGWGSICFPRTLKRPQRSLMKPESADIHQHADLLKVRCCSQSIFDFSSVFICCWLLFPSCVQHRKASKSVAPVERINVFFWETFPNVHGRELS